MDVVAHLAPINAGVGELMWKSQEDFNPYLQRQILAVL